jgi:GAF domain-containing protein
MSSFLGVPVLIGGEAWGNLYLAEKAEGEFTEVDEATAVMLAESAALTVETARLSKTSLRGPGFLPAPYPHRVGRLVSRGSLP